MTMNRRAACSILLLLVMAPGLVGAAGSIMTGDGMGAVNSYDPAKKTVMVGDRAVPLLPNAAIGLERQLVEQGRPYSKAFTAKFTVVRDASGQHAIGSIYVFPPKKR